MTWTQFEIDAWQAHTHRHLTTVTAAVLDLIDVGPSADEETAILAGRATTGRAPSTVEKDATYRANELDYQPSTLELRGGAEFYMAPEARTIAWEAQVQQAVTALFAAITAAVDMVRLLRVAPMDEHGRPLPAPAEPATREIKNGRRAGDQVVDIDPAGCRRHVLAAAVWLGAAVDAVADRLRDVTVDLEVREFVVDQAQLLGGTVRSLAGRMRDRRPDLEQYAPGARWCGCGDPTCERVTWPGDGAVHAACRKRLERARQAC